SQLRFRSLSPGVDGGSSGSGSASATTLWRRRVGALEVQVAARHPNRGHLLHAQVIHSKLASGRWPRLGTSMCLPNRLRRALESWGFETDRREVDGARKDENSTADGAGGGTPSAQHRPRPRVLIPWEFDHRDRMRRGDEVATSRRQGARVPDKRAHTDDYHDNSMIRGGARTTPATANQIATNNHDFHGKGSNEPSTSGENGSETGNDGDRRRSGRSPERPGMPTTTLPDCKDDGCSPLRGREAHGKEVAGVLAQENSSKAAEMGEDSLGEGGDALAGPVRAKERENDISAEEDEYDADFASQAEDSLVEEVDEDAADAAPGPSPFVAPKKIDGIHENDEGELEDAMWDQDAEEWEEEEKEEEVEEEEYGDDFDS
ncbi:unnamed protein product, partial [Ectocarpus sp. 13 AM-2016]